ncbi:hypothetical protein ACFWFI_42455 [Streptomyces sp. NPDC060209]|uniref:hypothetical protein n=1 Tax=Streptomyces sp. NPDC060209 TaxID=3347073 RepID=UPI003660E0F9
MVEAEVDRAVKVDVLYIECTFRKHVASPLKFDRLAKEEPGMGSASVPVIKVVGRHLRRADRAHQERLLQEGVALPQGQRLLSFGPRNRVGDPVDL